MVRLNWDLYRFALTSGVISMMRGQCVDGMKQVLAPILYWRFSEFSACLSAIVKLKNKPLKILDIGSPKLLSIFLAAKCASTVYATDLQDEQVFKRYKQQFRNWQSVRGASGEYRTELQDARALQYDDDTFDAVFSLEVLGHIPDYGDTLAIQEIHRVLKKNGIAVIALPFAVQAREDFVQEDVYNRRYTGEPIFYLRHYDESSIRKRLVLPSQMALLEQTVLGERLPFERSWDRIPMTLKFPFLWVEPLVSSLNLMPMNNRTLQKDHESNYKRAMNIILIFKKNNSL